MVYKKLFYSLLVSCFFVSASQGFAMVVVEGEYVNLPQNAKARSSQPTKEAIDQLNAAIDSSNTEQQKISGCASVKPHSGIFKASRVDQFINFCWNHKGKIIGAGVVGGIALMTYWLTKASGAEEDDEVAEARNQTMVAMAQEFRVDFTTAMQTPSSTTSFQECLATQQEQIIKENGYVNPASQPAYCRWGIQQHGVYDWLTSVPETLVCKLYTALEASPEAARNMTDATYEAVTDSVMRNGTLLRRFLTLRGCSIPENVRFLSSRAMVCARSWDYSEVRSYLAYLCGRS